MEDIGNALNTYLLPHWPFMASIIIFMIVGQVVKNNVFTKTAHFAQRPVWFWWWGRKTLPLQPIVAGMLLGLIWRMPEAGVDSLPESMAYFAMSGALSVWAYELVKNLAKQRGIDLNLPGVDSSNPPPKS